MTKQQIFFLVKSTATVCAVAFEAFLPSGLWAQGETQATSYEKNEAVYDEKDEAVEAAASPGFFSRITLDNNTATTADDYLLFPFVNGDGITGLGFTSVPVGSSFLFLQKSTPVGSMSLGPKGIGIGLSGFAADFALNAQAPLHVVGGGPPGPFQTVPAFPNAQAIIEDRNDDGALRTLFRLINGGAVRWAMENTSSGELVDFQLNSTTFSIGGTSAQDIIELSATAPATMDIDSSGNTVFFGDLQVNSSRTAKEGLKDVNGGKVLDRLARLPIYRWSYKKDAEAIEHMGPTAEDFHAAFGLGQTDKHISVTDSAGVALAAVQQLALRVESLERDNERLRNELKKVRSSR